MIELNEAVANTTDSHTVLSDLRSVENRLTGVDVRLASLRTVIDGCCSAEEVVADVPSENVASTADRVNKSAAAILSEAMAIQACLYSALPEDDAEGIAYEDSIRGTIRQALDRVNDAVDTCTTIAKGLVIREGPVVPMILSTTTDSAAEPEGILDLTDALDRAADELGGVVGRICNAVGSL